MSTTETEPLATDELYEQAMKLSPEERIELGERIMASVPVLPDGEEAEQLAATVQRRIQELEDGTVQAVPFEDAIRIVEDDIQDVRRSKGN